MCRWRRIRARISAMSGSSSTMRAVDGGIGSVAFIVTQGRPAGQSNRRSQLSTDGGASGDEGVREAGSITGYAWPDDAHVDRPAADPVAAARPDTAFAGAVGRADRRSP